MIQKKKPCGGRTIFAEVFIDLDDSRIGERGCHP
jgi:hypothetical protein